MNTENKCYTRTMNEKREKIKAIAKETLAEWEKQELTNDEVVQAISRLRTLVKKNMDNQLFKSVTTSLNNNEK